MLQFRTYKVIDLVKNKEPFTPEDVANELNITTKVASLHLKNLWMLDLMHICDWERRGKHILPVYRWGERPDVPRPPPLTSSQINKRYRARKKGLL